MILLQTFEFKLSLWFFKDNADGTLEAVLASIEETRKQGYAIDEEEYVPGVRCVAAPVQNAFGKTIAAIRITGSTSTFTKAKIRTMSDKVKRAASDIPESMGFG